MRRNTDATIDSAPNPVLRNKARMEDILHSARNLEATEATPGSAYAKDLEYAIRLLNEQLDSLSY